MVPVTPELTVICASVAAKASVPAVPLGLMALVAVKRMAPLVLVRVTKAPALLSLMVRSPPAMTSELTATVDAAVVLPVRRVFWAAVIVFTWNSFTVSSGRRPVPLASPTP